MITVCQITSSLVRSYSHIGGREWIIRMVMTVEKFMEYVLILGSNRRWRWHWWRIHRQWQWHSTSVSTAQKKATVNYCWTFRYFENPTMKQSKIKLKQIACHNKMWNRSADKLDLLSESNYFWTSDLIICNFEGQRKCAFVSELPQSV